MLRHASDVAAVDASPEMLAIAASRVPGGALVRFAEADVFTWEPDCRYDVVFTGVLAVARAWGAGNRT